jgi:hypothetical protein
MELMISWFTRCGGRVLTKAILIPTRTRKRIGKMNRRVLIFRDGFLSKPL